MSGNSTGAKKAAAVIKQKYGANFYEEMGRKGGLADFSTPRGFAANKELAVRAGKIGGTISRRGRKN